MLSLGPLVLVGLIVAVVVAAQRGAHHVPRSSPGSPPSDTSSGTQPDVRLPVLADMLDGWVADGLISAEQAHAILDRERSPAVERAPRHHATTPSRPRRVPVFAEALGYLGGVLALAGLTLLVANYWPDLATSVRLVLSFVTTLVLVGAGALVHEHQDPALARMRWFLWLLSSATAALFTGVLMVDTLDVGTGLLVAAACAGTIAVENMLLWWFRNRPIQELLFFVATIVAAGSFMAGVANDGIAGITIWILAAVMLAIGLIGLTPEPIIPHMVGAAAMMFGAFSTVSQQQGAGLLFATGTAAVLLLLASLPQLEMTLSKRVVLLVVAGLGALQAIPPMLVYFADQAGGVTGLATWAIGGAVMFIGARRLLRAPIVAETIGGLALIGGAALTAAQWPDFAPLFGLATAVGLIVIGMLPGHVLSSLLGSLGLLVNVPWAIARFFPGEGRAPLLILVSGALIIAVAVLLARQGGRMRTELRPGASESVEDTTPDDARARERSSRR
jgi:Predicted membrane protein (DUF2157)